MKSQDTFSGKDVMKDFEDGFFHLSGELGAHDDHFLLGEVEGGDHRGPNAFNVGWDVHLSTVEDVNVSSWGEVFIKLFLGWSSEHVSHEEGMIGSGTEGSNFDLMFWVPSCVSINDDAPFFMIDVIDGHFFN